MEGVADLSHARRRQHRYSSPKCLPSNRVEIVQVDHAVGWNAVRLRQGNFRDEPATRSGERGDHDLTDAIRNGVTGQHENWSIATRSSREPDLTALH